MRCSKQSVNVGRGNFCRSHEDNQEGQCENDKEGPHAAMSKAIACDISNQHPPVVKSSHLVPSLNDPLIEAKFLLPIHAFFPRGLVTLNQQKFIEDQRVEARAHEALISLRGRADNRFAPDIE